MSSGKNSTKEVYDTGVLNPQGEKIMCSKTGDKKSYFIERQGPKRCYVSKKTLAKLGIVSISDLVKEIPKLSFSTSKDCDKEEIV